MSATAQTWKAASAEQESSAAQVQPVEAAPLREQTRAPLLALVHQVFLHGSAPHKRVLFLAVDDEVAIANFCEQTAAVLTEISSLNCAVVISGENPPVTAKKPPQNVDPRFWRTCASPVCEGVWRLPSYLFQSYAAKGQANGFVQISASFDCLLFGGAISDNDFAMFSSICDAAVLVLRADRTRRQSAAHAKAQLSRCGIPLLGAVLLDRACVVPEVVHRWL